MSNECIQLSASGTAAWESDGGNGGLTRRELRVDALRGLAPGRTIEIYSADGVLLDALTADDQPPAA